MRVHDPTTMEAATATVPDLPHDRICDWHDEAARILPRLSSLPPNAQSAVRRVIASLAEEEAAELLGATLSLVG